MNANSYDAELRARSNLEKAVAELKRKHSFFRRDDFCELYFPGVRSPDSKISSFLREIKDILKDIEDEEKSCDRYLNLHCRDFVEALEKSPTKKWDDHGLPQGDDAQKQIRRSLQIIRDRASRKSSEIAADFKAGLERRINNFPKYGVGRPWGTEFRRCAAVALGISTEVNNLFSLGFNSITNARTVNLGEHFINLIKKDPEMFKINKKIDSRICDEIKRNAMKIPSIDVISMESKRVKDIERITLGGARTRGPMMDQFEDTLKNPVQSLSKYAATWKVAINQLTWAIRGAILNYVGIYHAVYNLYGFSYIREIEFSIDDKYDLRPRSNLKIDFTKNEDYAYNAVTSVLGSIYHDILGNTDTMRVRVKWTDFGPDDIRIYRW